MYDARLVEPLTRGDPESLFRRTCESARRLAQELREHEHPVSERPVAVLLQHAGYSLQSNRTARGATLILTGSRSAGISRRKCSCFRGAELETLRARRADYRGE